MGERIAFARCCEGWVSVKISATGRKQEASAHPAMIFSVSGPCYD